FGVYVHIPFCSHICPYCDFNTYALKKIPEEEYVNSLIQEIQVIKKNRIYDSNISSIYFGGGTPSLFSPKSISLIIDRLNQSFGFNQIEITIEVNPGEISYEKLSDYKNSGINRFSFGVQSFNDNTLKILGRRHNQKDIYAAYELCQKAQLENISFDLIYAAPQQSLQDLESDIKKYLKLNLQHISCYSLTIEKGTPFYKSYSDGKLIIPEDETNLLMLDLINQELSSSGYNRYEISNYAKPSYESKHNLSYWNYSNYLGLGAGAHSFYRIFGYKGIRSSNIAKPYEYIDKIKNDLSSLAWSDKLSLEDCIFEYTILGLRKIDGILLDNFNEIFDLDFSNFYQKQLDKLKELDLVELKDNSVSLTKKGIPIADSVNDIFAEKFI
ncbi:UNVERIFIED_CONTAM: hypothetical protein GTU68_029889, partial [Idotea baltica]|nr:hypothetical protein [Idotea baltica]